MDAAVELMLNAVRSSDPDVAKVRPADVPAKVLGICWPWDGAPRKTHGKIGKSQENQKKTHRKMEVTLW